MKKYSSSQNAFYDTALNSNIPSDAKEITETEWSDLLIGQGKGKLITSDSDLRPCLIDPPELSKDELCAQATSKKTTLITEANSKTMAWQTQLLLGIISDEDKDSLITWMKYVQAVQAVDPQTAPSITWPVKPV